MSIYLDGRIPKRMSSDLSVTGCAADRVGGGCLSSITSIILISSPRLETPASEDKGTGWMVNADSQ